MAKNFKATIRINIPEKLNDDLEKTISDQLGVTFEKDTTDTSPANPENGSKKNRPE